MTEDLVEAKLREIFRSLDRTSKVNPKPCNKTHAKNAIIPPPHVPHFRNMSQRQEPEPMEGEPQAKTARSVISSKYA